MIVELYQRDAQIDQMRYEALDNFLLTGTLEGRLFGDEKFEVLLVIDRHSSLSGSGWSLPMMFELLTLQHVTSRAAAIKANGDKCQVCLRKCVRDSESFF